jgi:hypothetical protein
MHPRASCPSGQLPLLLAVLCTFCLTGSARRHFSHATHDSTLVQSSEHGSPRVALALQGKSADVAKWVTLYSEMRTNESVSLFFLTYDEPAACPPGIFCYHHPESTWAQGRNELARRIFQKEEEAQQRFKYWAFHDTDTIRLDCWVCK